MKQTKLKIQGITPLLMHNGALADPMNEATQLLAKASSKRNKTLEDHRELSRIEWEGSLYLGEDGKPCIPGELLEACLAEGARKFKLGKAARGGLICDGFFPLEYDGPKTRDALWAHGGFIKRAGVRIMKNRVIRTRPMFPKWSCKFTVHWDPEVIKDEGTLMDIAKSAGLTGIGDWRPKYGRFQVSG